MIRNLIQVSKVHVIIFAASLSLLLSACGAFNLNDANKFRKGMSPTEVEELASKGPREIFEFTVPSTSQKYDAQVYEIVFGEVKSTYIVVFKDKKLLYWGYPYEFARHPDASLIEIGKAALDKYETL